MTTRDNRKWAQFRLAVIGSLIFSPLERRSLGRELTRITEQKWVHPISGNVFSLSYSTIERWYYQARSNPDDPLAALNNVRSGAGAPRSLPIQARNYIQGQVRKGRTYPFSEYHRRVVEMTRKHGWGRPPSYNVVRRYCLSLNSTEEDRLKQERHRLKELVAHLRRLLIAQSVVVHLLKNPQVTTDNGYARFHFRGLGVDDKLYVIRRLQDFQRSKGPMVEFCHLTGLAEASVSRWITEHARKGTSGLAPRKRRKFYNKTEAKKNAARIMEVFHSQPHLYGINRTSWTGDALAEAFKKTFHLDISPSTARRYLRHAGYTMRRAKQVLTSPDPQYREKVESLLSILQSLGPDQLFFFIDEMGPIRVKKHGGRSYVKDGRQKKIPQVQPDKGSVIILGALSATTNQMTWLFDKKKDSYGMIDLIEILFNQHFDKETLFISWDAASWHDSCQLLDWIGDLNHYAEKQKQGPKLEVVPLPARSQFLDVIESVFGVMKRTIIDNSNYQSVIEMKEAISLHFVERNAHYEKNPRRAGKKIWEIDFFYDFRKIRSGDYREW
jgi:transposase